MWPGVAKTIRQYVEFGPQVLRCSEYNCLWAGSGIEGARLENRVPKPEASHGNLILDVAQCGENK